MELNFKQMVCLAIYYGLAQYLPNSYNKLLGGGLCNKLRIFLCKKIFKKAGKITTINRKANFGSGRNVEIGDNSGLGENCVIPSDIIIGKNVMMGANCYILTTNHSFDRTDIPMCKQGFNTSKRTYIGDDVWIGLNVTMTPGRRVSNGTIIGACCLLCKDFPEYSIVGGNPSKLIRLRK